MTNFFHSRGSFIVSLDFDSKVSNYQYQLFEFIGILCRRLLLVFQLKNIMKILNKYILKRWTKEANRSIDHVCDKGLVQEVENNGAESLRSIHVYRYMNQYVDL